ncbi:DUF6199 family natural product biosynthesis protein [Paenibacillus sp. XY044]|uniref:DUF6199 family natural product biosynthesis protein n=1 Tax=Paenibacillus sp. XY044 TaxID=2026089 RepID=UPI000B981BB1|nr:DUF6199 family natural product biosynthesis protein [Paenibacillus sp. XY044]OZB91065.1 hypothetical protein CJP46_30150 [Paenibacillus sp. XY044]
MVIFAGILFIVIGILNIVNPKFAWYLKEGWKIDGDSEPSETYIALTRFGGIFALIFGIIFFFSGIFF